MKRVGGLSYHTCPRKEYFETLNLGEDGVVYLGDNEVWKVYGIGTVKLKIFHYH